MLSLEQTLRLIKAAFEYERALARYENALLRYEIALKNRLHQ